jgi:hypothetical protein
LVARYNYVSAKQDVVSTRSATRLALTNNGYTITDGTNAGTAQLFSTFANGGTNEVTVGYTDINDVRAVPIQAPFVVISRTSSLGTGNGSLAAGTENSSQGNELDQKIAEFTDNYSYPWGAHRFTVGTQNKFYKVRNLFSQNSLGNYTFGTLDSLINNTPSSATLGTNSTTATARRLQPVHWPSTVRTSGRRRTAPNIVAAPSDLLALRRSPARIRRSKRARLASTPPTCPTNTPSGRRVSASTGTTAIR